MDRRPPPLNQIRSFECAARHLSFTLASKELGFTQAAISAHVRSLEQYLRHPLFHRNARSLVLTEIGKAFLPTLRDALRQIDAATESVAKTRLGEQIAISCPVSIAESVLMSRLSGFLDQNPNVSVSVHGAVWDTAGEVLADLKIGFFRRHEVPPDYRLLWNESLVMVCSKAWLEKFEENFDISSVPKIMILGRHEYWDLFNKGLDQAEVQTELRHQANSLNIAMEMAVAGLGATVTPSSLAHNYLERDLLIEPIERRPESPWGCYIAPGSGPNPKVASRLMDWMLK